MIKGSLQAQGLTRTALALLFMAILMAASFWILHLFLTSLLWAAMIVVSTWPLMLKLQGHLWGKRHFAVAVMTLLLLMVLILPFSFATVTVFSNSEEIAGWVRSITAFSLPLPPDWIKSVPLVGSKLLEQWLHVIEIGPEGLSTLLTPYAGKVLSWAASMSGSAGLIVVEFFLTVFIAAIFYMCGDSAASWLSRFAERVAGDNGRNSLYLAASAIRAVAIGVVGTAAIQAALSFLGLALSGVPATGILTSVIFICCLAQLGPMPVMIPAALWLFWSNQTEWGIALVVWALFLAAIDNVIRPLLMKKGADLPMLLVFAGVTGGLMVFGIIGLFVGPVVLAVTYTLLDAWVTDGQRSEVEIEEKAS